ncbi:MAG: DUF2235 domain-containing protein [Chloroflexota bacterium]
MQSDQPKNIVIFSDGSGQDGGRSNLDEKSRNSNVYKAFSMIKNRTPEQVAFYHVGVGVDRYRYTGFIGGAGFSQDILDCYNLIFDHYTIGDQIYLLGFSRGAATVRSLASFIEMFGILPTGRHRLITDAFEIYRIRDAEKRQREAKKFRNRNYPIPVDIKFLGVWDTVAALGLPTIPFIEWILNLLPSTRHKFHDFTLPDNVKNAYQALAIDDRRPSFEPLIWQKPSSDDNRAVKQVWFAGSHSDVGGGFERGEQQLSDIALEWMLHYATSHGLQLQHITEKEPSFRRMPILYPSVNGIIHDSAKFFPYNILPKRSRGELWNAEIHGDLVVHQSVLDRANNPENNYSPWVLEKPHTVEPYMALNYTRREGSYGTTSG